MATTSYDEWIGRTAVDNTGEKLGEIKDIYYDDVTGRPEWVVVKTGLLGSSSIVPINGASIREHTDDDADADLQLAYAKEQIKDAPDADLMGEHLSVEHERELYAHYGFTYDNRTAEGTYGKSYGRLRPDVDYTDLREQRHGETTETQKVKTTAQVTVPVEANVRLRRYQTVTHGTKTVEVPTTEVEEHVEVAGVEAETRKPR